jgi:hypothetical protein
MHKITLSITCLFFILHLSQAQTISDDFQGNGNITTWFGDSCGMENNFNNPFQTGINNSTKI